MLERPPLSLYIHIPWCTRKCPYCDFNSHESNAPLPEKDYINALYADFLNEYSKLPDQEINLHSIFIGGGTPSLFTGESYYFLLQNIKKHLNFSKDIEITLEANPGSAEMARFSAYRDAGINRLSLGIQSFDNKNLEKLGRIHNKDQAISAIEMAKTAGFGNFNVDLMHGLPGQSPEYALKDLKTATELSPSHISWYQLTIEPNTLFFRYPPPLPNEDILLEIQKIGNMFLEENGYPQYEISAFSTPSYTSAHNRNYWSFGDYIGIGAGAHGKLTLVNEKKILRTRKSRQPNHYIETIKNKNIDSKEILVEDRALEFLMNALRLKKGFSKTLFEHRTGLTFNNISNKIQNQINKNLMQVTLINEEEIYSTTKTGYRFLNSVLEEFI